MKKWIILAVILFLAAGVFGTETEWFDGDFEAAKVEAEKQDKLVLMLFYASG
jgi:hypothetical protein